MSKISRIAALLVMSLLLGNLSSYSHHSFGGEFDGSKLQSWSGVMTQLKWENPHGWFYMDVTDKNGKVTQWALEIASPNILRRADENLREYFLENIGKPIYVVGCPAWKGDKGAAEQVKFHDGRISPMGGRRYTGNLNAREVLEALK